MEQNEKLQMLRHSMAHVLAKAVTNLYEDVKLTIGPAIDDGFYYDFDMPNKLTPDDFEKIENEMLQIIKKGEAFERKEVSKAEALEFNITDKSGITDIPLQQLKIRKNTLIGSIYRNGNVIFPGGQDKIKVGDTVMVVLSGYRLSDIEDILEDES
jgi:threonyl-tRNA synthetase